MENSTIVLVVWLVLCIVLSVFFIWYLVRDSGGVSLRDLHFTPPTPPPAWQNKTEKKPVVAGPWFLVVYADVDERNYTAVAAEDVLDFQFCGKRGEMRIHCKKHNGFPDNTMRFENIYHYEFQQASQLGDYCLEEKE